MNEDNAKKFKRFIYQLQNMKFERCFWPLERCSGPSIKAHSIQNAGVLELLQNEGHLFEISGRQNLDEGPEIVFRRKGRNLVTTFTGLCSEHDSTIFREIDVNEIDVDNSDHLFLLAYRSILKELHAKMRAAVIGQESMGKLVEMGELDGNERGPIQNQATLGIIESYSFYRYKNRFDNVFGQRSFKRVEHKVYQIDDVPACLAVSSTYAIKDNTRHIRNRLLPEYISLNVFPHGNGIAIVFSYLLEHQEAFSVHANQFGNINKHHLLYSLSKMILMYCENIVFSPSHVSHYSETKKMQIIDYFSKNIWLEKIDSDNQELYLF